MTNDTNAAEAPALRVLVLGATGYVGGRLIPQLLEDGHAVRCLVRSPKKLEDRPWRPELDVRQADLLDPATLAGVFDGIDVVYYLVHSIGSGDDFQKTEERCARHTAEAAAEAGVSQIIYLGGLGNADDDLSPHLASRQRVGEVLAAGPTPVCELRAAVILGSGSASFEMVRGLTEVLPIMVTPRWVNETMCQPVAVRDVLQTLTAVLGRGDAEGVWEIGGPDVVSYAEMMHAYAEVAGLRRRLIIPVPVLTPRLSSRWVDYVTTLPVELATELVESLQNDVVVGDNSIHKLLPTFEPLPLQNALEDALAAVADLDIPTRWTSSTPLASAARPRPWDPDWAGGTVFQDVRTITVDAPAERVMAEVRSLGGENGWLAYDLLWDIRGLGDVFAGGIGSRRGRRLPDKLLVGDTVDMFRVEESTPTRLRLRAEMKLPGFGWLEWTAVEDDDGRTTLTQLVRFVPKGVWGRLYWGLLVPFHYLIFSRMLAELAKRAYADGASHP